MRIASWSWGGRLHVGTVDADGREATPLTVADAARGAQWLIEALARGEPLPSPAGARLPVDAVELRAPLPRPLRNLWCVGRNYHAHAAELADSVFRASLPVEHAWPIVFSKVPECVIGPHDTVRLPGAAISSQIDYESELAVVIGRGGRDIARSRGITLYPGDVIATGTPSGVGMGFSPPRWLVSGDVVRIEIDGIGVIENRFE